VWSSRPLAHDWCGALDDQTGKILQLLVADGKEVAAGEALLVMESMKMESKITAHKVHSHTRATLCSCTAI
jgi:acetyl/propionyl-CoA carboxylase alpha subunit